MDQVPAEHLAQENEPRAAGIVSASYNHKILSGFVGVEDESVPLEDLHVNYITCKRFN